MQNTSENREEQIKLGRFSVREHRNLPKFEVLFNMVPKSCENRDQILQQLETAFVFRDNEMIGEIKRFITQHIHKQTELFV